MKLLPFVLTAFLVLLFSSCPTAGPILPDDSKPEYSEALISKIEDFISQKMPQQAFMALEKNAHYLEDAKVSALHTQINDLFLGELKKALDEYSWEKADTLLQSIIAVMPEYNTQTDRKRILQGYFSQYMEKNFLPAALILLSDSGFTPNISTEELDRLIGQIALTCDKASASLVLARFSLSATQKKQLSDVLNRSVSRSTQLKATVTIFVQKGIKIEKGVGMADTVIGTGFFIDGQGHILTNYHVISTEVDPKYEGFSRLYISLSDDPKTKILAKVIGWDPVLDLAMIKAETVPEYAFSLAAKNNLEPGESVLVIGSPLGLENTLTSGIVSALNRRFLALGDTVQIDAPVNPGNSGGPVILADGTAGGVIFAGAEGFEGINFMIPAVWVRKQIPKFYQGGMAQYSWLGLGGIQKSSSLTITWNKDPLSYGGALTFGTVLSKINFVKISKPEEVQTVVSFSSPGIVYRLELGRDGDKGRAFALSDSREVSPLGKIYKEKADYLFWPLLFGFKADFTGSDFFGRKFIVTDVFDGTIAEELGLSANDPLLVKESRFDPANKTITLVFEVKRQKAGFLNTSLQISASLDSSDLF